MAWNPKVSGGDVVVLLGQGLYCAVGVALTMRFGYRAAIAMIVLWFGTGALVAWRRARRG